MTEYVLSKVQSAVRRRFVMLVVVAALMVAVAVPALAALRVEYWTVYPGYSDVVPGAAWYEGRGVGIQWYIVGAGTKTVHITCRDQDYQIVQMWISQTWQQWLVGYYSYGC